MSSNPATYGLPRYNNYGMELRTAMVYVDSRFKEEPLTNATDANFRTTLGSIIDNVVGIRVVQSAIPNSQYNINTNNNTLVFNDGNQASAIVASGNYTETQLAAALQTRMNAVGATAANQVVFNALTQRFEIQNTAVGLSLLWQLPESTLRVPTGYDATLLTAIATVNMIGQSNVRLGEAYYKLSIDILNSTLISNGNTCFAIITNTAAINAINFNTYVCNPKLFPSGIKLKQMQIRFENPDSTLVNFNGVHNTFALELIYYS